MSKSALSAAGGISLDVDAMRKHGCRGSIVRGAIYGLAFGVAVLFVLFLAFGFFVVLPPERKAVQIGEAQAQFSKELWREIYREAIELHREHYRGEPVFLANPETLTSLTELGYNGCRLNYSTIMFSFGGGHMQTTASVCVTIGSELDPWTGIHYNGGGLSGVVEMIGAEQAEDDQDAATVNSKP